MAKKTPADAASKGRPKGAKTRKYPEVAGVLTRCPKCDSTERGPYLTKTVQAYNGVHKATGEPFTGIVRRKTKCLACGQHRIDSHLLFDPAKKE